MSSQSFFRKLTAGITFDTQKFNKDAAKFGLVKPVDNEGINVNNSDTKLPCLEEVKAEIKLKRKKEKLENASDDEENDITVLGGLKTVQTKKKKKKTKVRIKEAYTEQLNQFRNANNIHVTGTDVPEPFNEWQMLVDKYGVSDKLTSCIPYQSPTPIQMQTIPVMLSGISLYYVKYKKCNKTIRVIRVEKT